MSALAGPIRVVLLAGDEEYRSEEAMPQLAKILTKNGFSCKVVYSIGVDGYLDPNRHDHQPGIEALDQADACVMLLRFRAWPDAQMKHFVDYYLAGKPIVALRTSTHAFDYDPNGSSAYKRFGWRSTEWKGGFGRQVLGETWVSHWGVHKSQATRAIVEPGQKTNPILRDVGAIFCTTDVYEAAPPTDATILLRGEVVAGITENARAATGVKKTSKGVMQGLNDPMMPIAWTRVRRNEAGETNRIFTTTMGCATDILNPSLRRLIVNAVYWSLDRPVPKTNVDLVGTYQPSEFGFDGFRKGVRPPSDD